MAKRIGLSYTASGGTVYNFILDNFGGSDLPRSYTSTASYSQSANGTTVLEGPATRQKYQWAISSVMDSSRAPALDEMFRAWDTDRAAGLPVACGITDNTFGAEVSAAVVFVTPPSYDYMGPGYTLASFGLQEV